MVWLSTTENCTIWIGCEQPVVDSAPGAGVSLFVTRYSLFLTCVGFPDAELVLGGPRAGLPGRAFLGRPLSL